MCLSLFQILKLNARTREQAERTIRVLLEQTAAHNARRDEDSGAVLLIISLLVCLIACLSSYQYV